MVVDELGLVGGNEVEVVEVEATVAIVELLLAMLLVDEAVETVDAGGEADWQSKPTL